MERGRQIQDVFWNQQDLLMNWMIPTFHLQQMSSNSFICCFGQDLRGEIHYREGNRDINSGRFQF